MFLQKLIFGVKEQKTVPEKVIKDQLKKAKNDIERTKEICKKEQKSF